MPCLLPYLYYCSMGRLLPYAGSSLAKNIYILVSRNQFLYITPSGGCTIGASIVSTVIVTPSDLISPSTSPFSS